MTAIVDASVVLAASWNSHPSHEPAIERVFSWMAAGEDIHVPELFMYEVASGVTQVVRQYRPHGFQQGVWRLIESMRLSRHKVANPAAVVAIALQTTNVSAYDASYIELSLQLGADFWTLDRRLVKSLEKLGLPVRLLV